MNYDDLEKLNDLRQKGAISEEEYQAQKARILNQDNTDNDLPLGLTDINYCTIMNLIQLAPGFGWIISITMWIIARDKSREIDIQGKYIINWLISILVYTLIGGAIAFVTLGIGTMALWPLGMIVGVCTFVFPIIAGIKSLSGELWRYPLSIQFLK